MTILVTGSSGFIGRHFIQRVQTRHDVMSMDIRDAPTITHDLTNPIINELHQHIDVIVHFAANSCIRLCNNNPLETYINNVTMLLHVLEYARLNDSRVIFISSSNADNPTSNVYGLSKHACEDIILFYRSFYRTKVSIVRPFNVYGPGSTKSVINIFQQQYLERSPLTITGDGENRRDFTHVSDIVMGLERLLEIHTDEVISLGTGTNYSINEVAEFFNRDRIYLNAVPGELRETKADIRHAKRLLNWQPSIDLRSYIAQFKQSLKVM